MYKFLMASNRIAHQKNKVYVCVFVAIEIAACVLHKLSMWLYVCITNTKPHFMAL